MKIVLASASPRRRELLKVITDEFDAVSTNADESLPDGIAPDCAAEYLSGIKAESVLKDYPDSIVLGSDTTVICGDSILGKPSNRSECREFLKMLSGKTHYVITGCTIAFRDKQSRFSVKTEVTFRDLSEDEIEKYISTDEPYDKAGGYAVQGKGALLIEKINGDYFNVVGLPISRLNIELKKFMNYINKENVI